MLPARDCSPTLPEDRRGIYLIGQRALEQELEELDLPFSGGTVCSFFHDNHDKTTRVRSLSLCIGARRLETHASTGLYDYPTKT